MEPGIYYDLSREQYDAIDAINPSSAKVALQSMSDYAAIRGGAKMVASEAMKFGTAVHHAIFEPEKFASDYVRWNGDRRGKAYTQFLEQNPDKIVPSQSDYDATLAIKLAVHTHPLAAKILDRRAKGKPEVSIVWIDSETGLLCKGRLDWLYTGGIADLKKFGRDWTQEAIGRQAYTLGYHISLAAYRDGMATLRGETLDVKTIYAQEKPTLDDGRHKVAVMPFATAELELGLRKWREALNLIDASTKADDFSDPWEEHEWPMIYPEYLLNKDEPLELSIGGEPFSF